MMNRHKRVSVLRRKDDNYRPLSVRRRWYADDNTTSTEPENVTGENNNGQSSGERMFTQSELDAIIRDRLSRAKAQADDKVTSLLGELGVESPDMLKTMLSDYNKRREAEMSEAEKAQAEAERLRKELMEAKTAAEEAQRQRESDRRNRIISDALKVAGAQHPDDLLLIASNLGLSFDNAFNENGEPVTTELQAIASKLKELRPNAFGSSAPGSPSNAGGRVSNTEQVMKEAQKQIQRKFGLL